MAALGATVFEEVELQPRTARFASLPEHFRNGAVGGWVKDFLGQAENPYLHQSRALGEIAAGRNPVVSTATASGKSFIFMAAVMAELLDRGGTVLVFYPLKALGSDQCNAWQNELERAGLPRHLVAEINGDVPMAEREKILDHARVVLATPDTIHAWMMPMSNAPSVKRFLGNLAIVVIDEAHSMEAVFGSHFSFFFRRLRAAHRRARTKQGPEFQVIATTATLRDPVAHLQALTGMDFVEIGEADNGAPSFGISVLHIDGPEAGAPAERAATETIGMILEHKAADSGVIAFLDSRQGVERIVCNVDSPKFLPYRQGYVPQDRRAIEVALRTGQIDGVAATSALEAGIHLPQFDYGVTINVPPSRKSLRQRAGRIGRTRPGVFVVQGPRSGFAKLGTTLSESLLGPVERSPLYRDNRYVQLQQAFCYLREAEINDAVPLLDEDLNWPKDFDTFLGFAEPGARRPRDLEEVARLGFDNPHRAFSLRSMPSITYVLKNARMGEAIGTIDQQKALREAAPGMNYLHYGQAYRVSEWRTSPYENSIILQPIKSAARTQAILRCQVGASIEPDALIHRHYLTGGIGAFFEGQLRVAESVEGYRIGSNAMLYRDLRQSDRRLTRKQREFQTTGVVIQIDEPWFAGTGDNQVAIRRTLAEALRTILVHEYGIAPADLQAAHTSIALHSAAGARKVENAIAIFDTVVGGLRLSAPLFGDFAAVLKQLERGTVLAGTEALISPTELARLQAWYGDLTASTPAAAADRVSDGCRLIYAPGSRVIVTIRGESLERELIEPQLLSIGDEEKLMYRYDVGAGAQGWVADDLVIPAGNDWQRASWDPATNVIKPLELS